MPIQEYSGDDKSQVHVENTISANHKFPRLGAVTNDKAPHLAKGGTSVEAQVVKPRKV